MPAKKNVPKPAPDGYYNTRTVPGTPQFTVDGFKHQRPDVQHYFLTHFHADHYDGLNKSFDAGIIYCSEITANLLQYKYGIRPDSVSILPLEKEVDVYGIKVTALDANHCPGAVMLLFKTPEGVYLFTGDFRYSPEMCNYAALQPFMCGPSTALDAVYLDNTFGTPQAAFPSQLEVIQFVVDQVKAKATNKSLVLIGTYTIGKERVFTAVARALGCVVYVDDDKYQLLLHMGFEMSMFRRISAGPINTSATCVVAVPMVTLFYKRVAKCLDDGHLPFLQDLPISTFDNILAFSPSGWSAGASGSYSLRRQGPFEVHGVPYSEHSDYKELLEFVRFLKPKTIVPAVDAKSFEIHKRDFLSLCSGYTPKNPLGFPVITKSFSRTHPQTPSADVQPSATGSANPSPAALPTAALQPSVSAGAVLSDVTNVFYDASDDTNAELRADLLCSAAKSTAGNPSSRTSLLRAPGTAGAAPQVQPSSGWRGRPSRAFKLTSHPPICTSAASPTDDEVPALPSLLSELGTPPSHELRPAPQQSAGDAEPHGSPRLCLNPSPGSGPSPHSDTNTTAHRLTCTASASRPPQQCATPSHTTLLNQAVPRPPTSALTSDSTSIFLQSSSLTGTMTSNCTPRWDIATDGALSDAIDRFVLTGSVATPFTPFKPCSALENGQRMPVTFAQSFSVLKRQEDCCMPPSAAKPETSPAPMQSVATAADQSDQTASASTASAEGFPGLAGQENGTDDTDWCGSGAAATIAASEGCSAESGVICRTGSTDGADITALDFSNPDPLLLVKQRWILKDIENERRLRRSLSAPVTAPSKHPSSVQRTSSEGMAGMKKRSSSVQASSASKRHKSNSRTQSTILHVLWHQKPQC
mmetsp:Transcript_25863/g.43973  ORF Transcript_25863/g.43973 Transcript_25863/m.43973 type:complete len:868 (+) Transcript_25863:41-2644(+)